MEIFKWNLQIIKTFCVLYSYTFSVINCVFVSGPVDHTPLLPNSVHVNGHSSQVTLGVVKRGRGRPRLDSQVRTEEVAEPPSLPHPPVKKRGRKSKKELEALQINSAHEDELDQSTSNEGRASSTAQDSKLSNSGAGLTEQPRKRGRPRIVRTPEQSPPSQAPSGPKGVRRSSRRGNEPTTPSATDAVSREPEPQLDGVEIGGDGNSKGQMKTRNQGRRTAFYNEEDSEEEQRQLLFEDASITFGTSSKGRVRKLTEKAKANLIGW